VGVYIGVGEVMSIFDNAIQSIQIGLDDYLHDNRLVSSVRNIYAGILLLFKYKLVLLSGDETNAVLIKQNIVPVMDSYGTVIWKGMGNKTIDVVGIKSRFKSLGISVDWKIFDRISRHRNEVEHFFSPSSEDEVTELLADCFIVISRFLSEQLSMDAKEVLGEESWQVLLHAYEVYEFEVENSARTINALEFYHDVIKRIFLAFRCIRCSSPLIKPSQLGGEAEESSFCCAECDAGYTYDDVCNMGVPDFYLSSFWSGVAGNEHPFSNCKECEQGLFLKEFRVCTACGLKGS